jgi:hypothetical protein
MARQFLLPLIFSFFFSSLYVSGQEQKKIAVVDFYAKAIWGVTPIARVPIESIFRSNNHRFVSYDPVMLSTFDLYLKHLSQLKKSDKLKKKWAHLYDYRLGVKINYNDSTSVYIACGEKPYIDFNGDIFEDKGYTFLILLNSQFDLPVIRDFVTKEKIIK